MAHTSNVQLAGLLDTRDPRAVIEEIRRIFCYHYPKTRFKKIKSSYGLIKKLFEGRFPGFRSCNTEYHNLTHTLDATLACARLLDGYNLHHPPFSAHLAECLLLAGLLHDTGYIQESWDTEGTGAKYTSNHVERSVGFLDSHASDFGASAQDAALVAKIIRCTGLSIKVDSLRFDNEQEREAGCILGTADLLGQMSDRTYLEKLLFLYYEFKEANVPGFNTEFDLIRKTLDFYEIAKARMNEAFRGVHVYAQYHFKTRFAADAPLYLEAIERHMDYLRKIVADDTTNFRHKLKRGSWIKLHFGRREDESGTARVH
ncbi:MAG: hypothetical protein EPN93_07145 [Spirochaetes bacterium]|nr:MAG: hypothetical protein EPN93_07145 [Spirochaetota bacterium]